VSCLIFELNLYQQAFIIKHDSKYLFDHILYLESIGLFKRD
jgi:hypothetical protein